MKQAVIAIIRNVDFFFFFFFYQLWYFNIKIYTVCTHFVEMN